MLFKLAFSGMKGRKKESFLLGFVIFLSVMFIVTATVLHASNEAAKTKERMASFGPWENGYFQVSEDEARNILLNKNIDRSASSQLLGYDPSIGLIGSYNQDYEDLTTIQMVEGSMPKSSHEIAIEHNTLATYPTDIKIGDVIQVPITLKLHHISDSDIMIDQLSRVSEEFEQVGEILVEAAKTKSYDELSELYGPEFADYAFDPDLFQETLDTYKAFLLTLEQDYSSIAEDDKEANQSYYDILKKFRTDRYQRYILDTEQYDDYTLNLKSHYRYYFSKAFSKVFSSENPETYTEDDLIYRDGINTDIELIFTCSLTITGFYENHNEYWDLGESQVPKAYITQELYDDIEVTALDNPLIDISKFMPFEFSNFNRSNILIDAKINPRSFYEKNKENYPTLRVNSFTYPDQSIASESTITYAILFMIFTATIIAVFQINLSQIKRRSKKLTLLKAIGMVKSQIFMLLCYELMIFVLIAFPLGLILGLSFVYGLVILLNALADITLVFTIDYGLMALGLLISFISVMIGMSFPMFKALNTSLTGAMNTAPKRSKKTIKTHKENYKTKIQSFGVISWSYLVYEKKKNLLTIALYTISITVLLVTLFLSFLSFDRYKNEVIAVDRPDYAFESIRAMSGIEVEEITKALDFMPEVENYQFVKYGINVFMHHPDFKTHPVFKTYFDEKEVVNLDTHDEATALFKNESLLTNLYAIEPYSYIWDTLTQNMNSFDLEAFKSGQGVLLLLPQYMDNKDNKLSYDIRDRFNYKDEYGVAVGDEIQLGFTMEPIAKVVLSDEKGTVQLNYENTEILAIAHYMGEDGVWPFSQSLEAPVMITSIDYFNKLYPKSKYRSRMDINRFKVLMDTQFPTAYGRSSFYIYTNKGADSPRYQIDLQRLGLDYDTPLTSLVLEKNSIFQQSLKLAAIIITLGLSIALIILMILFNTSQSKVENERTRIGVLQALGVTKKQFKKLYILTGLGFGLMALITAHILLAAVVIVLGLTAGGPLMASIENILWLYPFKVHLTITIIYLLLSVITYYVPLKKILQNQPIYNINNNQR